MQRTLLITFLSLPFFLIGQVVSFSADTTRGCLPLQVNFNSQGISNQSVLWLFGDGNSSTMKKPTHLYLTKGNFDVTLILTKNGISDTIIQTDLIQTHNKPEISYSIANSTVCLGQEMTQFINHGDSLLNYTWDLGDGNLFQSYTINYKYLKAGSYQTMLFAEDSIGCKNSFSSPTSIEIKEVPSADFSVDTSLFCTLNQTASFQSLANPNYTHKWDFDDGDSSSQTNPQHSYTKEGQYWVSLKITADNGCVTQTQTNEAIQVINPPTPIIQHNDSTTCSNSIHRFIPDSNWVSAQWNFGDGNTSSELIGENLFQDTGTFNLNVFLSDSFGCKVPYQFDPIKVLKGPIAGLSIDSVEACSPYTVKLKNTSLFANHYFWKVGTNSSITEHPTFTFDSAGTYNLMLTASNQFCTDTLLISNWLNLDGGSASILTQDTAGCVPFKTKLRLTANNYRSAIWYFGDGDTSSGQIVTHEYEIGGNFQPFVVITTQNNCNDTIFYGDTIKVEQANFQFYTPDTLILCDFGEVKFNGSSMGGKFWNWDFGDGQSSTKANPTHYYDSIGTFIVSLKTENTVGCHYFIEPYNIVKVSKPSADFKDSIINCPFYRVDFTPLDSNLRSWEWDFGDGFKDSIESPSHYYGSIGYFHLSLRVENEDGCLAQKTKLNEVVLFKCKSNGEIDGASIGANMNGGMGSFAEDSDSISACAPFLLEVDLPFDTVKNQWWNFGDGFTSTDTNASHTYTKKGIFDLELVVEFMNGTFDTILNKGYVQIGHPTAKFNYTITNSCDSSVVQFVNSSDNANSYSWNLCEAGTSDVTHPKAIYKKESNQLIELTAFDEKGCFSLANKNITSGVPNPFFDFEATACLGDTVTIKSNAEGFHHYEWEVGNLPIQTGEQLSLITKDTGRFTVKIHAYDISNCKQTYQSEKDLIVSNPVANFTINDQTVHCDNYRLNADNTSTGAETFLWKFSNGDSSIQREPNYIFKEAGVHSIELIASKDGCSNTFQHPSSIIIHKAKADYSLSQNSKCLPIKVHFTDQSIDAVKWFWNFGDGTISTEQNPIHVFNSIPDSAIYLSIIDANGCSDRISKGKVEFHQAQPIADKWGGCIPLEIQFDDTSSKVTSYFWDFGDGNTSTLKNPVHTYPTKGKYDITLITQSLDGCSDTTHLPDAVRAGYVVADFISPTPTEGCAPYLVQFTNKSIGATEYQWSFEDDKHSSMVNPIHVYKNFGRYDVKLISADGFGCSDTLIKEQFFSINSPAIDFSLTDTSFCGPSTIYFKDLSQRVSERTWFFGDGSTSQLDSCSHFFKKEGRYMVSLQVKDTFGCVEFLSTSVTIKKQPLAKFSLDSTYGCAPAKISLRNHSSNLNQPSFNWMINTTTVKNVTDTSIVFHKRGEYDIGLIAKNKGGCSDTLLLEKHLKIYKPNPPQKIRFLSISRNSANDWNLSWERSTEFEFKYYQLYKRNELGVYEKFIRIKDQEKTNYSMFYNTSYSSVQCFKIEAVNHCVSELGVDNLDSYCSVDLTTQPYSSGINLNWSNYPTATFSNFEIQRKPSKGEKWTKVATVSSNQKNYTDVSILCPESYDYRIIVKDIYGHAIDAFSVTSKTTPAHHTLTSTTMMIRRATVVHDESILLEWELPANLAKEVITGFRLQKAKPIGGFQVIADLEAWETSFIDDNVEVDEKQHVYKLDLQNNCTSSLTPSVSTASIWLTIDHNGSMNYLKWTAAENLKGGVEKYLIQKKDEFGVWKTIKTVNADQLDTYVPAE